MDINKRLVETYLELIGKLGFDSKLELISKLTSSMKKNKEVVDESILKLFGSFDSELSAEEIISQIREARSFNRKLDDFE